MPHRIELGVKLGRLIEHQQGTDQAVAAMRVELKEVRKDVTDLKKIIQRAMLLVTLWGSALGLALTNERAASILVSILQTTKAKG